jgi:hypothetical protein
VLLLLSHLPFSTCPPNLRRARNVSLPCHTIKHEMMTIKGTGQNRTGQDRTGQDRTGEERRGEERRGEEGSKGEEKYARQPSSQSQDRDM